MRILSFSKFLVLSIVLAFTLAGFSFAIPKKVFLNIPFSSQAPFGDWSKVYNEACEEISIIMVMRYVNNRKLTKEQASEEILKLTSYEQKNYGWQWDISTGQVAKIIKNYYKYDKVKIIENVSIETILDALGKGNPIIVPLAGRMMGNPHYKRPGPVYHMIVIKGYDLSTQEFITNDGGTKYGLNYRYKFGVLYNAIHDWSGSFSTIYKGP